MRWLGRGVAVLVGGFWLLALAPVLLARDGDGLGTLVLVGDFGTGGGDIYTYTVGAGTPQPLVRARADFDGRYIDSAACPPGSAWVYFTGSGLASVHRETGEIRSHTGVFGTAAVSASPDGAALLMIGQDSFSVGADVFRYDIATDRVAALVRDDRYKHSPVWAADGVRFAYVVTDDMGPVDWVLARQPGGDAVERLYTTRPYGIAELAWSPVGDELAVIEARGRRWVLVRVRGGAGQVVVGEGVMAASLVWSGDGRYLVYNRDERAVRARDMRVGVTAPVLTAPGAARAQCWVR